MDDSFKEALAEIIAAYYQAREQYMAQESSPFAMEICQLEAGRLLFEAHGVPGHPTQEEVQEYRRTHPRVHVQQLPSRRVSKVGKVYVMLNPRNGYVKIGFSVDPRYRETTLQSEEPEVKLLAATSGDMDLERSLHRRYADKRLRGEWFSLPDDEVEKLITELMERMA